ncbi:hypothetical protein GLYMA_01G064800v4 [Glycine max]|nr:hypothetical protein GLYMA_01G064800v4 [Glycine max]KAH1161912.1 hypothetical protein GYH30_000682 [Glycine max]
MDEVDGLCAVRVSIQLRICEDCTIFSGSGLLEDLCRPMNCHHCSMLHLQETGKRGFGIVVAKDIKVGEFVIEYVGEGYNELFLEGFFFIIIIKATYDLQVLPFWNMKQRGERNFYLCEINRDMVIDATYKGNKSRYTNHSCCPNTEMQKWIIDGETRIGIFATSDIQKDIYAFGKFWRCWSLRNYASMTGWLFYVSNYIVGLLHLVHIKIAIEVLLSASVSWVSDLPSLNFL